MLTDQQERQRKRLLEARAALDRAARALSNTDSDLYDELALLRDTLDFKVIKVWWDENLPGAAKPLFLQR